MPWSSIARRQARKKPLQSGSSLGNMFAPEIWPRWGPARSTLRPFTSHAFLAEAFRGRLECIAHFRQDLSDYIDSVIQNADSLVTQKIALEAVGLCDERSIGRTVMLAGALQNAWIDETAFRSCQYLSRASAVKRELGRDVGAN